MWTRDRGSGFRIGTASVIGMKNGSSLLCGSGPDPHMPGRKLPGMDGMDRNAVSGGNGFCPGEGNGNRRQQDRRNRRAAAAPGFGPARLHPGRHGLLRIVLKHGLHGIADGAAVFRRGPAAGTLRRKTAARPETAAIWTDETAWHLFCSVLSLSPHSGIST